MTPIPTYHLANPYQQANGVRELQTALVANHFYYGPVDGIFGTGTAAACKRAKYRLGYPIAAVQQTGGQMLLDFLTGQEHLPAAYMARRKSRGYGISAEDKVRAEIVNWLEWGVTHNRDIHYTQDVRRDDGLNKPAGTLPIYTDCSGFVTFVYKWSGAPDPNGFGYKRLGYTGTMLQHGLTVPLYQAELGDLVVWGWYPGHHVAAICDLSNKDNPLLIGNGSESGPNKVTLADETRVQNRPWVIKKYLSK